MGEPLERRELLAGLEEFEHHLLRSGVIRPGDDRPRVGKRSDERGSGAAPQGAGAQASEYRNPIKLAAPSRGGLAASESRAPEVETADYDTFDAGDSFDHEEEQGARRFPRSVLLGTAILLVLAGLGGAGAFFWASAPRHSGSETAAKGTPVAPSAPVEENAEAAPIEAAPQDEPSPAPAAESAVEAPQPPSQPTDAAMAKPAPDLSGFTDPTPIARAPGSQAVAPAATLTPPDPKDAEALTPPSAEAPSQPVAALPQPPAVAPPAAVPKAPATKKPKPAAATKPKNHPPEKAAKPTPANAAAQFAPAHPAAPASAPAPAAEAAAPRPAPDAGPFGYINRAGQAVKSLFGGGAGQNP